MIMKNLWLFMPFSFSSPFPNLPLPSLWFSFLHKLTTCLARKKSLLLSWNSSTGPSPERENDLCHYSFNIPKAQEQLRMRGSWGRWVVWARLDEDIMKDEAKIFPSFSHSLHILCATILLYSPWRCAPLLIFISLIYAGCELSPACLIYTLVHSHPTLFWAWMGRRVEF